MKLAWKQRLSGILPENPFVRGVSVLVGGTAGAQVLAMLAAPLLTRLYGPADFGTLAVYTGILSLFSVIASFKYESAIPLPENEDDVVALTFLALMLVLLVTVVSGFFVHFWGQDLSEVLNVPELAAYLWLLPGGILLVGTFQVLSYWAIRLKQFPDLAHARIRQQIATIVVQVAAFALGGIGLLLGHVSGKGVGLIALSKNVVRRPSWRAPPIRRVKFVAGRYRSFPFFSTWAGLLNVGGTQLPPIIFASLFGPAAAGFYALANRIIAMPMSTVGQAVGQVFLSNAAMDYRAGRLPHLVLSAHRALVGVIIPPVVFLILFGPAGFKVVFGDQWATSGQVASWLALWMLVAFATSPLSTVFTVVERQGLGMILQGILFLVRVFGIAPGVYYQDFMIGIVGFSLSSVVGYFVYQSISFSTVGLTAWDALRGYLYAIPIVLMALALKVQVADGWLLHGMALWAAATAIHYYRMMKELRNAEVYPVENRR